jgi:hypothetical protein
VAQSGRLASLYVSLGGNEAVARTLLGMEADLNAQYEHLRRYVCPMTEEEQVCDGFPDPGRRRKYGYRTSTD